MAVPTVRRVLKRPDLERKVSSVFGADQLRGGKSQRVSAALLVGFPKAFAHEIAIALAGAGWRSDITSCAQDGLRRCATRQYELIMVNFQHVEPFAPEVVTAIRSAVDEGAETEIVAIGGYALAQFRGQVFEAGAQHVLTGRSNVIAQIKNLASAVGMRGV